MNANNILITNYAKRSNSLENDEDIILKPSSFGLESLMPGDDSDSETKIKSLGDLTELVLESQNIHTNINDTNEAKKKSFKNLTRKQIHFKVDTTTTTTTTTTAETKQNTTLEDEASASNLHEKLNQLKNDEIKKRRLTSVTSNKKKKDRNLLQKCLDPKEFNKKVINFQSKVYYFLERPVGHKGFLYRLFTFTIILGSIITGALTTVKSMDTWSSRLLFWYELFVSCYFGIEFLLRAWSIGHRPVYKGFSGRIKFICRPLQIIEITLILISILILSSGCSIKNSARQIEFNTSALSALRFFQIFRFLFIDRQAQTWVILSKVIQQHRFELLSSVYIGVIILLFSSYFILIFEKPHSQSENDNHFHSYADAIYWSIITMATIGYGDRSPRTFMGKIISTSLCIVGVAFWTLPGGIIGSGFALKVEQKNKKKQFNRLIPAAASLIQAWWRMKATLFISSSNVSCLIATVSTFDISHPIYSTSLRRLKKNFDSGAHDEMSFLFTNLDSPSDTKEKRNLTYNNPIIIDSNEKTKMLQRRNSNLHYHVSSHSSNYSQINEENSVLLQLSPEHLILIRTILLLKFFRAQTKFKLAFKPYDFKDVIDQYTQGNMDILLKMKDLQRKIDQVNNNSMIRPIYPAESYVYVNSYEPKQDGSPPSPGLNQSSSSSSYNQNQDSNSRMAAKKNQNNNRRFVTSEQNEKSKQRDLNQLNERMNRIENELDNLSKKLDKLITISTHHQSSGQN